MPPRGEELEEEVEEQKAPSLRQLKTLGVAGASPQIIDELRSSIREEVVAHLEELGLVSKTGERDRQDLSKQSIRDYHRVQREDYRSREDKLVSKSGRKLLERHLADGCEIAPDKVEPTISVVQSETEDSDLFRLATLFWSVPVSRGYGRRMRFLVRDKANGKLMGIFALADPVFNIHARDDWIGWSTADRRLRLVNVMDAYIAGAVPPYNQILGGKVVASMMTAGEVCEAFVAKYQETRGQISGEYKHAQLVLITVTSALGRSSIYNRLKLPGVVEFQRIGMTSGWGHFQIPGDLFLKMRQLLHLTDNPYWWRHRYGMGPNWKMRVVRAALEESGLDGDLLRHGIKREIFAAPLSSEWRAFLKGEISACDVARPSAAAIGRRAVERWLAPRAARMPEYRNWTRADTWELLSGQRTFLI